MALRFQPPNIQQPKSKTAAFTEGIQSGLQTLQNLPSTIAYFRAHKAEQDIKKQALALQQRQSTSEYGTGEAAPVSYQRASGPGSSFLPPTLDPNAVGVAQEETPQQERERIGLKAYGAETDRIKASKEKNSLTILKSQFMKNPDLYTDIPGLHIVNDTGTGAKKYQQSQYIDSSDGMPLKFDPEDGVYLRSDGSSPKGSPVLKKGDESAITSASSSVELVPKIKKLFDDLDEMGEAKAKSAVAPGVGKVFFPEIRQARAELERLGFTFGGKNLTGNEKQIVVDSFVPGVFDNKESRALKRDAAIGYISGNLDLLQAANLLGPAGGKMRSLLEKNTKGVASGAVDPSRQAAIDELKKRGRVVNNETISQAIKIMKEGK